MTLDMLRMTAQENLMCSSLVLHGSGACVGPMKHDYSSLQSRDVQWRWRLERSSQQHALV